MKALADRASSLLPLLDAKGKVYLFALFERDDISGKWDVVLSSDWSDKDASAAVRFVSEQLVPLLNDVELAALSRVVIIPSSEPGVLAMSSAANVTGGCLEVVDSNFMGLDIKHAFVFRCAKPAIPATAVTPT
jgi:hypothetical protein